MWAVSSGSYSDYRVLCVCATKKDAERIIARAADEFADEMRVEQKILADDTTAPEEILNLTVNLWDDGTEGGHREWVRAQWPWDYGYAPPVKWRWVRAPIHDNKGGRLEVSGSDHERVRRVFSDRRAQIKAEDALRLKPETGGPR